MGTEAAVENLFTFEGFGGLAAWVGFDYRRLLEGLAVYGEAEGVSAGLEAGCCASSATTTTSSSAAGAAGWAGGCGGFGAGGWGAGVTGCGCGWAAAATTSAAGATASAAGYVEGEAVHAGLR